MRVIIALFVGRLILFHPLVYLQRTGHVVLIRIRVLLHTRMAFRRWRASVFGVLARGDDDRSHRQRFAIHTAPLYSPRFVPDTYIQLIILF